MDAELIVYFFQGKLDEEDEDGWNFGVESVIDIPTKKYVAFCEQLKKALEVLNEEE